MKTILCSFLIICSVQTFGKNVACVLTDGVEKSAAKINFQDLDEDGYGFTTSEGAEFDLGLNFELYCEGNVCEASLVIDSQILEDEAGSTGFEIKKDGMAGVVFMEPITNAPDEKDYALYCYLNK